MKKHIPNLFTSLNLAIGAVGIYWVLTKDPEVAFYFVIISAGLDFLDGFAARILDVKSEIGKQLDSLADLVSFGLLPSFFMLTQLERYTQYHWIGLLIAVFSALRLAKFNVDESQTDSFKGLPTPANAIMLTSIIFLSFDLHLYSLASICVLSSFLLVAPIRLLALKFSSFGWKGNEARWILIIGIIGMIGVFGWTFVPLIIPFYVLVSIFSFALHK